MEFKGLSNHCKLFMNDGVSVVGQGEWKIWLPFTGGAYISKVKSVDLYM